jgi:hypothetical protein
LWRGKVGESAAKVTQQQYPAEELLVGANWVQTVPGKGWNVLFRLCGPLQPCLDKTWRSNPQIEEW